MLWTLSFRLLTLVSVLVQIYSAKECGISSASKLKIYFGELAKENELPWQVSLEFFMGHNCGGSIIADNWIITAAHCVILDDSPELYKIKLGSLNSLSEISDPKEKLINVKRIVVHPEYNQELNGLNDLALIELAKPIGLEQAGENINSICLGRLEDVVTGREVVISGWGGSEFETLATLLRRATVAVGDFEKCQKTYDNMLWKGQVCVKGNSSVCFGDSGGPLQYSVGDRWYLMGVASMRANKDCRDTVSEGVYTRVPEYLDFIRNITGI